MLYAYVITVFLMSNVLCVWEQSRDLLRKSEKEVKKIFKRHFTIYIHIACSKNISCTELCNFRVLLFFFGGGVQKSKQITLTASAVGFHLSRHRLKKSSYFFDLLLVLPYYTYMKLSFFMINTFLVFFNI